MQFEVGRGRRRGVSLVVVVLAASWLLAVLDVVPARACSCAEPELDRVVADATGGQALVLAERVDMDGGPDGELRILDTLAGGPVEGDVHARFDDGGSCDPGLSAGAIAGLVLAHENGRWTTTVCGMATASQALAAAGQAPRTEPRAGPPTMMFGGDFGGPRLAALDAAGQVVAWAGEGGRTVALGACPGNDVVLEVASTDADVHLHRWSVSEMAPLGDPVDLGPSPAWDAAVTCQDATGSNALVVLPAYGRPGTVALVRGGVADGRRAMVVAAASGGGTVAAIVAPEGGDGMDAPTIARVTEDGELVELVTRPGTSFDRVSVSPSGEHVLAAGYPVDAGGDVVVLAATDGSGAVVRTTDAFHTIGWVTDQRAYLRLEEGRAFGAASSDPELMTTDLEPAGRLEVGGGPLVGLADDAVLRYGTGFPSVIRGDTVTPIQEPRLADATAVLALDPAAVLTQVPAPATSTPTSSSTPTTPPTTAADAVDSSMVGAPAVLGAFVLLGIIAAWVFVRERRA